MGHLARVQTSFLLQINGYSLHYLILAPDEDFDAVFPTGSSDSYLMIESVPVSQLTSLTVSLWLKIYDCPEDHPILVYSTTEHEKEISLKLEKSSPVSSWVCKLSITMKDVEYVTFLLPNEIECEL